MQLVRLQLCRAQDFLQHVTNGVADVAITFTLVLVELPPNKVCQASFQPEALPWAYPLLKAVAETLAEADFARVSQQWSQSTMSPCMVTVSSERSAKMAPHAGPFFPNECDLPPIVVPPSMLVSPVPAQDLEAVRFLALEVCSPESCEACCDCKSGGTVRSAPALPA